MRVPRLVSGNSVARRIARSVASRCAAVTSAPPARRPSSERRRSPLERRASTSSGIQTSQARSRRRPRKPAGRTAATVYSRAPTRMRLPMMSAGWPTVVHRSKLIAADSASGPCSSSRGTWPSDAWTPRTAKNPAPAATMRRRRSMPSRWATSTVESSNAASAASAGAPPSSEKKSG